MLDEHLGYVADWVRLEQFQAVREIEQAVLRDHPNLFPSPAEISRFVAQALGRDTES